MTIRYLTPAEVDDLRVVGVRLVDTDTLAVWLEITASGVRDRISAGTLHPVARLRTGKRGQPRWLFDLDAVRHA